MDYSDIDGLSVFLNSVNKLPLNLNNCIEDANEDISNSFSFQLSGTENLKDVDPATSLNLNNVFVYISDDKNSYPEIRIEEPSTSNINNDDAFKDYFLLVNDKGIDKNLVHLENDVEKEINSIELDSSVDKSETSFFEAFENDRNLDNHVIAESSHILPETLPQSDVHQPEKVRKTPKSKSDLSCPHCVLEASSITHLNSHIQSVHQGSKRFSCKHCDSKFYRVGDLKTHMNIHSKTHIFICHVCGKQFNASSNLLRHLRVHSKVKPFACDLCSARFSQSHYLVYHKICHTTGGQCTDCKAEFQYFSGLQKHLKSAHQKHITLKDLSKMTNQICLNVSRKFRCSICGETFALKKDLTSHEKECHSNMSFPCKSCYFIYKSIPEFKTHTCFNPDLNPRVRSKCEYSCKTCKLKILTFEGAKVHECPPLHTIPQKKEPESNSLITCDFAINDEHSSEDFVVMSIEKDQFQSISYSRHSQDIEEGQNPSEHVTLHVPNNSLIDSTVSKSSIEDITTTKSNKRETRSKKQHRKGQRRNAIDDLNPKTMSIFCCPHCPKTFRKKVNLGQHVGLHDPSVCKYQCDECKKTFAYQSTYRYHLKMHKEPEPKVVCTHCGKCYKDKNSLSQHIRRVHFEERSYTCSFCSKSFFDKSVYSFHLRLHTKEQPYVCSTCGKMFSHLSHIYRHERYHAGEHKHKCSYCSKSFSFPSLLRKHLKKHESLSVQESDKSDPLAEESEKNC